jgi:hypothetical protein
MKNIPCLSGWVYDRNCIPGAANIPFLAYFPCFEKQKGSLLGSLYENERLNRLE